MADFICPACGAGIPEGAGACPLCGIALREVEIPEPEASAETGPAVPAFRALETVLLDEMSVATAAQASLEAMGYETFLADANTKTIDPFITGGYAFQVRLLAPRESAEEVRGIIAGIAREREDRRAAEARAQGRDPALEARARRVASLGYLAILCTLGFAFAPVGLLLAAAYLLKARGLRLPPALTFFTAVCAVVCLGLTVWFVAVFVSLFG